MQKVTLTIVIPAYNEASRIGACLERIRKQTIMPDEVIVVDNNSTDDTAKIARSFPFVTVIHEKQQGISHAHRAGFEASQSTFIARLDADSILPETFVERIKDYYSDSSRAQTCIRGSGYAVNLKTRTLNRIIGDVAFVSNDLMSGFRSVWGPCMVVPRTCWDTVKDSLCEEKPYTFDDLDLGLHLHEHGYLVIWLRDIRVGITLRHITSVRSFLRYNLRTPHTLRHHGSRRWLPSYIVTAWTLSLYPLIRVLNK